MKDKEYVKKVCSKCKNRDNDKDLCNIVKTLDGDYRCSNEDVIKVGEYIKTCTGEIRKITGIADREYQVFTMDKKCLLPIYTNDDSTLENLISIGDDQIIKHSKEIADLILEDDFIIYTVTSNIVKVGLVKKYKDKNNNYYLGVEGYDLTQMNIKKVITRKEIEKVGYKVE